MCMFNEKKLKKLPQGFGYKVFSGSAEEPLFDFQLYRGTLTAPRRKWLKREAGTPGFHVLATRAGARAWVTCMEGRATGQPIIKVVRMRGPISEGYWRRYHGFLVKEIYIP